MEELAEVVSSTPAVVGQDPGCVDAAESNLSELIASWLSLRVPREQIRRAMTLATDVFEDPEIAKEWLSKPNLATDNEPPIALLGTELGLSRVEALLHRIEHGILA